MMKKPTFVQICCSQYGMASTDLYGLTASGVVYRYNEEKGWERLEH